MTTATLLREYHEALDRQRRLSGLRSVDTVYDEDHDISGMPPKEQRAFQTVRDAHDRRVAGQGSPAECSQALHDALKEIGNG